MFKVWEIKDWCVLAYLLVAVIWDMKKRTIPVWYLAAGTIGIILYQFLWCETHVVLTIFGAMVGATFLLISRASCQGIGYGDSWMILLLGMFLGVWKLFVALGIAFMGAAIFCGVGLWRKKLKRKSQIPFFPFLAIGYLGTMGW